MFDVSDLPDGLQLVQQAPGIDGAAFNPVHLIRAVNGLLPLGKDRALDLLSRYVELVTASPAPRDFQGDEQRVFLIVRVLFVRDDGVNSMPPLLIGAPEPRPPAAVEKEPLFPIVILQEIPFLLVASYGWMLGGQPESPLDHLRFCAEHCRLRESALAPKADAVQAIDSEPRFREADWAPYRPLVMRQALHAMAPTYTVSEEELEAVVARWPQHVRQVTRLQSQWDPATQEFTARVRD